MLLEYFIRAQKVTVSGFLLAVGLILPYITAHGIGVPGTIILPMHIPVLLCGFLCGPMYGCLLGIVLPILSGILTGMPTLIPMAFLMTAELGVYGITTGVLNNLKCFNFKFRNHVILIIAMLTGRLAYGFVFSIFMSFNKTMQNYSLIASVITGLPGIIIQLILIPIILKVVKKIARVDISNEIIRIAKRKSYR